MNWVPAKPPRPRLQATAPEESSSEETQRRSDRSCGVDQRLRALSSNTRSKSSASTSRSEEHTSELQSPDHLVCRLLLEKKKNKKTPKSGQKFANRSSETITRTGAVCARVRSSASHSLLDRASSRAFLWRIRDNGFTLIV